MKSKLLAARSSRRKNKRRGRARWVLSPPPLPAGPSPAALCLEDHGWLIRIPGGAEVAGQHRRDAWRTIKG